MATPRRNYSQETLKILFGQSGNQCAHPDCTNNVIEPATEKSDAIVSAQICHIHSISPDGSRALIGLTAEKLNSLENLILLCPTHHGVVDGQPDTYTANVLKEWKQKHLAKMENRFSAEYDGGPSDFLSHPRFPTELVDQKIKEEIDKLRKSRFFTEFDGVRISSTLAKRLVEGDLSGGTNAVRREALGWCIRFLSRSEELAKAEEYLNVAKELRT